MGRFTLLMTACVLVVACSSAPKRLYSGNPKLPHEVALLSFWLDKNRSNPVANNLRIYYSQINQRKLRGTRDIEVLPGEYRVLVHCEMDDISNQKWFEFSAQAGREYAIVAYADQEGCQFDRLKWVLGPAGVAPTGQEN